jgi:hypothetical protein
MPKTFSRRSAARGACRDDVGNTVELIIPQDNENDDAVWQGRQQYCQVPVVQFILLPLGLVCSVWRTPLYRRVQRPQRALAALQLQLFNRFAG